MNQPYAKEDESGVVWIYDSDDSVLMFMHRGDWDQIVASLGAPKVPLVKVEAKPAATFGIEIVSAPGDMCGGSRKVNGRKCPGCRACS